MSQRSSSSLKRPSLVAKSNPCVVITIDDSEDEKTDGEDSNSKDSSNSGSSNSFSSSSSSSSSEWEYSEELSSSDEEDDDSSKIDNEGQAGKAYSHSARARGKPVKTPRTEEEEEEVEVIKVKRARDHTLLDQNGNKRKVSKYVGVCWLQNKLAWKATIRQNGSILHLGLFENEESAAQKYDQHASLLGKPVNFPTRPGQTRAIKKTIMDDDTKQQQHTTSYVGIYWDTSRQKWAARASVDCKMKTLGRYDNAIDAARRYDEHAALLGKPLNFPEEGQVQALRRHPWRQRSKNGGRPNKASSSKSLKQSSVMSKKSSSQQCRRRRRSIQSMEDDMRPTPTTPTQCPTCEEMFTITNQHHNNNNSDHTPIKCAAKNSCTYTICRLCVHRQFFIFATPRVDEHTGETILPEPHKCPGCRQSGAFSEENLAPLSKEAARLIRRELGV